MCELSDIIMPGDCVDHIKRIEDGGAKWDWSNLQTLCNSCHARKSGQEAHR